MKALRLLSRACLACCVAFTLASQGEAVAQQPVDLRILNIPQDTHVWCWAAVAQQIIHHVNGRSPPQCALVAASSGIPPQACCAGHPACIRTGGLHEIQGLIAAFGGHYSSLAPPAHPMALYQTLRSGRAVILHVRSSPYSSHVVVLRGMRWIGGTPVLLVNDPMGWMSQEMYFQQLMPHWLNAIVVH